MMNIAMVNGISWNAFPIKSSDSDGFLRVMTNY